jgi:hypothetical protein
VYYFVIEDKKVYRCEVVKIIVSDGYIEYDLYSKYRFNEKDLYPTYDEAKQALVKYLKNQVDKIVEELNGPQE